MSNDYGIARFYESHHWSRDGLKEHWLLDPGVQGDLLGNAGDFETWTGPDNGCTDCPEDWTCDCTTYGGDIDQVTIDVYSLNASAMLSTSGVFASLLLQYSTFEANTAYQFSFCYKGESGVEDLGFVVSNLSMTDSYDFTSDTWTGALTYMTFGNISAVWTRATVYLTTGPTEKSFYLWGFAALTSDGTAIYVDNVKFRKLSSPGVIGAMGNILSVPVGSDQTWGDSEVAQHRVGTGPAGKSGMKLDGVDDFLERADDGTFDPINWNNRGFLSVGARAMTDTIEASSKFIVAKAIEPPQNSYKIYRHTGHLYFRNSDDGTDEDFNSVQMFALDTLHSFVSTFDPSGGAAAFENNLYYDAYQVDTDSTMTEGAPFNTTADFNVGALQSSSPWSGSIFEVAMWDKELTAIEANKFINPFFPGTNHGPGFYVDTCSQAASHATCSGQKCRDGTPNACQPEGTGAMALFGSYTELIENNNFAAFIGSDDAPNFNYWSEVENPGDGTSSITAYRADTVHGDIAARVKLTGTTSNAWLNAPCMTAGIGSDVYAYLKAKTLGTANSSIVFRIAQYDTAVCTTFLSYITLVDEESATGEWTELGGLIPAAGWDGSTSSYILQIIENADDGADTLFDTISFKAASYRTPWIHNPSGAGTTAYNNRQYELHNPLSDYIESEDEYGYESGFCMSAWVYTDWAGDDGVTHYIIKSPPTAGSNNIWFIRKTNTDNLLFNLYDSAGAFRQTFLAVTGTNWSSEGWKYVEICSNNSDNTITGHWYNVANSTWYDLAGLGGAGTGIQDGQQPDLHIGHNANIEYLDGYISEIHIGPYSDIFPMAGFNSGNPPVNGNPY